MTHYDYIVAGGGIVGISTARELLLRQPTARIALLEKEPQLARHQSGHNSGVIHAGIYYPSDSLKADFCIRGAHHTMAFCRQHNIPFEQRGKLVVATSQSELAGLEKLAVNSATHHIDVQRLDQHQLQRKEPYIRGLAALLVKQTAIVDYRRVALTMAQLFRQAGGIILTGHEVVAASENVDGIQLHCKTNGELRKLSCGYFIGCAGLMSDRLTALFNIETDFQIIPFRGEYFQLKTSQDHICQHLIYPVPDPELPFLGIHLTPMIDGGISAGPNALLGWKREGYGDINFNLRDSWDNLRFAGFWRLLKNYRHAGLRELGNSISKRRYSETLQRYCPSLDARDLLPHPCGVRAQAVKKDGSLVQDFLFSDSPRSLHICNAPSPAATSAMPIAEYIVDRLLSK